MSSIVTSARPTPTPTVSNEAGHDVSAATLLSASDVSKSYRKGSVEVPVLRGANLRVVDGQFYAIVGQSGSGKSTLLHLLATLDVPDDGQIYYEGNRIDNLAARGRDVLRNRHFGMIFQFYHLLPELTTLENVLLPAMIGHGTLSFLASGQKLKKRALQLLDEMGLGHRRSHKPGELSGGEMQRVAIARSLMSKPRVLFADEPTGNLDSQTGSEIMAMLHCLNRQHGLTIVMVTHDLAVAGQADVLVRLENGRLVSD